MLFLCNRVLLVLLEGKEILVYLVIKVILVLLVLLGLLVHLVNKDFLAWRVVLVREETLVLQVSLQNPFMDMKHILSYYFM